MTQQMLQHYYNYTSKTLVTIVKNKNIGNGTNREGVVNYSSTDKSIEIVRLDSMIEFELRLFHMCMNFQ